MTERRREWRAILSVSTVHFVSHVHILTIAPLFPLLREAFGVSYATLGLVAVGYNLVTMLLQTPVGRLVDRLGAVRALVAGLLFAALCLLAAAGARDFWQFALFVILAGIPNAVYHPADMSLLVSHVAPGRRPRAFAAHSVAGAAGFAVAPILMGGAGLAFGWQAGLVVAALLSAVGLLALLAVPKGAARPAQERPAGPAAATRIWARPQFQIQFGVFVLFGAISAGLQGFLIPALDAGARMSTATATLLLSAYLAMNTAGVVLGGAVAGRFRAARLMSVGMGAAAVLWLVASPGVMPTALVVLLICAAGACNGLALPSRDTLLAEQASGANQAAIFGFVTAGLPLGQILALLVAGPMIDHGHQALLFPLFAAMSLAAVLGANLPPARRTPGA